MKRFFKASVITPRLDAWTQMLREDVECDLTIEPNSPGIKTQWTLRNFENNMKITDGENMGVEELWHYLAYISTPELNTRRS